LRFLDRSTRKVAACFEGGKLADVNSVYRRVDWRKFFRKRGWVDGVVTRDTNVENK